MVKKKEKKNFKRKNSLTDIFIDNLLYYFFKHEAPKDTVESLPFEKIYDDGTVKLSKNRYSRCIKFEDLNYKLSSEEEQYNILNKYAKFLSYFSIDTSFQFTFTNTKISDDRLFNQLLVENVNQDFNGLNYEYYDIIKSRLKNGNNGIVKNKYVSFSVEGKSYSDVILKIDRISKDIIDNFSNIGVEAKILEKKELLEVIKDIYYNDGSIFEYDDKRNYKYQVAPKKLVTKETDNILVNNNIYKFGIIKIDATELSDTILDELLEIDNSIIINMTLKPYLLSEAKKQARLKLVDLEKMKYNEIVKAKGIDIVPYKLNKQIEDINNLLTDLDKNNDNLFDIIITVGVIDKDYDKVKMLFDRVNGILLKHSCSLSPLLYEQEQALNTSLPINNCQLKNTRTINTTGLCMFVPFSSQELITKGESLYYGINSISNNVVMFDRKLLRTPNALYLGTPGSGKSFLAKKEIVGVMITTTDDVFICDPEAEYISLVNKLGGITIDLSLGSKNYINPFDIDLNYNEDGDPVQFKAEFILSFCEQLLGGAKGLSKKEVSIIDKGIRFIYRSWKENPIPENIPLLEDLYNFLVDYDDLDAKNLAITLELYVHGNLNLFNHRTNIDINNRLINFNVKNLGKQLINVGMLVVQDMIWSRVTSNRKNKKYTWFYIDEFHLLLRNPQTAEFSLEIWKRFRKWGGIPTGMTQNVKDFLHSLVAENILDTSDCKILLNQNSGDRDLLQEQLKINDSQLKYITNSNSGSGLIFYNKTIVPFYDEFPIDTNLYKVMSSKLID